MSAHFVTLPIENDYKFIPPQTPLRGVLGGTEPKLSDPDSLLCQLVALAGWQGYTVFKRLMPRTSPEKVRQAMAAYREQNAESPITHPVVWLATALREGWSPNPKVAQQPFPTPKIPLPSDPRPACDPSLPVADSSSPVPMPE